MKKLFKLMLFLGLVAGAVVVVTTASRKRATGPRFIKPTPWNPPVVDEIPAAPVMTEVEEENLEEAVVAAEDEGMTPPPEAPAEDIALSASGEAVVSELASPEATAEVLEEQSAEALVEEAVAVAEDEGMTPPPEEPAEDVALNAEGEPVVSELAAPGAAETLRRRRGVSRGERA